MYLLEIPVPGHRTSMVLLWILILPVAVTRVGIRRLRVALPELIFSGRSSFVSMWNVSRRRKKISQDGHT